MLLRYIELLLYRSWLELKRDASGLYLGMLWWVIEPILYMLVFYVVFGVGLRKGGLDYVLYLLCGLVPWKWFDSTVRTSSGVILSSVGLMRQVYFPKWLLPFYIVLANTYKFFIIFSLMIISFLWGGVEPSVHWIHLPLIVALQFFLVLSVSFLVSSIVPLIPDLRFAVSYMMSMLFLMSGIFFSVADIVDPVRSWLMWLPTVQLIEAYREIFLRASPPDLYMLSRVALVSGVFFVIGFGLLTVNDRYYPRLVK